MSLRVITMIGMGIQGYAIWAALSRSLVWPIMWPSGVILYATILLIYYIGFCIQNATLASELIRKTRARIASRSRLRRFRRPCSQPRSTEIPGYEVDAFYKPLRAVGGDYFDVVDLPGDRTLFVVADVSGKGMAAALLAANIQALVRSLSTMAPDVPALASQINRHLFRYTPGNRFATAVFIVLDRDSGELVYVNAGHNPPIVWRAGQTTSPRGNRHGPGLVRRHDLRRRPDDHPARRWTSDLHRRTAGFDSGRQSGGQPVPGARHRSGPHDVQPQGAGGSQIQRGRRHRAAGEARISCASAIISATISAAGSTALIFLTLSSPAGPSGRTGHSCRELGPRR